MLRIQHLVPVCLAASLLSLALVDEASAAPKVKGADGKRFRLNFDTDFFGFTHTNLDGDNGNKDNDRNNAIGFGIGRLTLGDATLNSFGIGFGYVFAKNRAIIGGRFSLVVDGDNLGENSKGTNFRSQFAPYFQWMFLPGRWVRPYVEARVGIGGGVSSTKTTDAAGNEQKNVNNTMSPFGGVGGGVHLFPVEYFSVDLGLNLTMAGVYAKTKTTVNNDTMTEDWDNKAFVFNLAAMAGVSTWF